MVYVIRHGDKAKGDFFNPRLRHQDQPLSRLGRAQARALRRRLCTAEITGIYVSEYIRTGQTIAPLARAKGVVPVVDPRLNEIDVGELDKMPEGALKERYPEVWKAYLEAGTDYRWPGGETGGEAASRMMSLFREKADPARSIILVAHEGIIRCFIAELLGIPAYRRFLLTMDTAGVTEIGWEEDHKAWRLVRMNQTP